MLADLVILDVRVIIVIIDCSCRFEITVVCQLDVRARVCMDAQLSVCEREDAVFPGIV